MPQCGIKRRVEWICIGRLGAAVLCLAGFACARGQDGAAPLLKSIEAVRQLSPRQLAEKRPVELEGMVISYEPRSERIFLMEGGLGLPVRAPQWTERPVPGSRVRLWGLTTGGDYLRVKGRALEVLVEGTNLPPARTLSPAEVLDSDPLSADWLRVEGFVQSAQTNYAGAKPFLRYRVSLFLREGDRVLHVLAPPTPPRVNERLRLSRIEARGVFINAIISPTRSERLMWVQRWGDISVIQEGPADPFARAVYSLALVKDPSAVTGVEPVRLRAHVVEAVDDTTFLLATSVSPFAPRMRVRNVSQPAVHAGEVVDVLGYPLQRDRDGYEFDAVEIRWLGLPGVNPDAGAHRLADYVPQARSIQALRRIPPERITNGWPVRLTGVVTAPDKSARAFYLQTGGGYGTRVHWPSTNALPAERARVRVVGHALPGLRHPQVTAQRVELIARRAPLNPRWPSAVSFMAGEFSDGFVALSGVVRSVGELDAGRRLLRLECQGELLEAEVNLRNGTLPRRLVGSKANFRGIATARKTPQQSFPVETLVVASPRDIEVLRWSPKDPFELPLRRIESVLRQSWHHPDTPQIHLRGVVTAARTNRAFIDDGSGGIELRGREPITLRPGDVAEAVGFPMPGRFAPMILDAALRKAGTAELPPPMDMPARGLISRELNGRRIRARGEVVGHSGGEPGRMELRAGDVRFIAVVPGILSAAMADRWPPGSELEVTGVCQYFGGPATMREGSFLVYANGLKDIRIINDPPWWTVPKLLAAAWGVALLALAAIGWAAYFRNRARQSRSQFLTTFHANPMPAWIIRRSDRRCVEVNGEFERLFGIRRQEMVGHRMKDAGLWVSEADRRQFLEALAANPSLRAIEARLQSRDGRHFHMLLSAEAITVDDEDCVLIIAYDITERLKLLEQLRQSQKMEAVGQLAAGVAHDFNNLLTVVRGNAGLIQLNKALDEETSELTREIAEAGVRAAELTGQLLTFSRKSVMQRRVLDLREVVKTAAGMLSRMLGETIEVSYACPEKPVLIKADANMMDQVLLNLGVNARDAMPEGGQLSIRVRTIEYSRANLPPNPDAQPGRYAVLEVQDDGVGMSEEVREHAFDPFYTTKDVGKGTGLGLSTVYGILRQHGGWIDIDSEPGRGANFIIHLPMTEGDAKKKDRNAPTSVLGRGDETILVVEDEEPVRQTVRRTLTHYGYTVLEAVDGPAAEALWRERSREIDLVLTDLVMPSGLSGIELARRMKSMRPELKVVYMTGHSQELIDYGGQLRAGVDFLPKPFENRELVRIIRERLDAGSAMAQPARAQP